MIEMHLLLVFMIVAALIAVVVTDLVSSVIAVGAVGIGLSMSFLVLKAPELAIMQLVVEILSLIILIRATIRKDLPFSTSGRWIFNTVATVVFLVVFLIAAYLTLRGLPPFGHALARVSGLYLEQGGSRTGAGNLVEAIALDYRALDALAEATALIASVVGVLAIARTAPRR